MEKEYVATFKTGVQISPDDWESQRFSMKVLPSTTMAEIAAFYGKIIKGGSLHLEISELI